MSSYDDRNGAASSSVTAEPPPATATAASSSDRVTLEIKGAKLNVAIQNALRRKRSHDRSPVQGPQGRAHGGDRDGPKCQYSNDGGEGSINMKEGPRSAGGTSAKEVALLKAAAESLRAGIREKEDAATELERDKETLLEKVSQLESTTQENFRLGQKVAEFGRQIESLEAELAKAEAGRALTMSLVETLKSAHYDIRASHAQVSQRYAELENMLEDSAEAVRRGNVLLHSQQLKTDAQARQIKRQDEDLATLREEREMQLAKADRNATELAQVLRRERAGQSSIADAQVEVGDLKAELAEMRDAFAKHRGVVRKSQEVIDAHEKALKDARSELLSLSLEADKQSSRHHQASAEAATETARATADKNAALRESRAVRIEKEGLKDKLEEAGRKLDELQAQQSESAAAIEAVAARRSAAVQGGYNNDGPQRNTYPKPNSDSSSQAATRGRRQHDFENHAESIFDNGSATAQKVQIDNSSRQQQGRSSPPVSLVPICLGTTTQGDKSSSLRRSYRAAPAEEAAEGQKLSSTNRPSISTVFLRQAEAEFPREGALKSTNGRTDNNHSLPSSSPLPATRTGQGSSASPATSAADAGGGGGSGTDRRKGGEGDAGRIGGTQNVHHDVTAVSHNRGPNNFLDGAGRRGQSDGTDIVDGGRTGASGPRSRSRFHSPAGTEYSNDGSEAVRAAGVSVDGSDDAGSKRKRAKRGPLEANAAAAAAAAAGAGGLTDSLSPPLLSGATSSSFLSHFDAGNNKPGKAVQVQGKDGDSTLEGVCPSCGDTPYGLMINCSGCARQYHSSCVPDGQKVGKGLGATVFLCSKCSGND
ncbi:unnamed protein product [Ectocarpus sp. 4 AP-2014]